MLGFAILFGNFSSKEIPRTSVGKFHQMALRRQFVDWKWES